MNHEDGKKGIPFISNLGFMGVGEPFMKVEDFTPEVIVRILKFRPHALFGGEISTYRREELPRFIYQFRYLMPEKFDEVAEIFPQIREALSLIGEDVTLEKVPLSCMPGGNGSSLGFELLVRENADPILVDKWDPVDNVLVLRQNRSTSYILSFSHLYMHPNSDLLITCAPQAENTLVSVTGEDLKRRIAVEHPQYVGVPKMDLKWKKSP